LFRTLNSNPEILLMEKPETKKRIGIAADHGGYELKIQLVESLVKAGYNFVDYGAYEYDKDDDYPDLMIPLACALAKGDVTCGIAICGSGVGASVALNKVHGVRAAIITDPFSAHQGVEDDDLNILCLGGRVTGPSLAWELVSIFLNARFKGTGRFVRRLNKVTDMELKTKI
jgi:ribose 5-phosphate isomerase B